MILTRHWKNSPTLLDLVRLKKLREVSVSKREKVLVNFWAKRDPTPGTEENELMQEFYRRIAYATEHYGYGSLPGWRTDRGRIYINYGQPDYTMRQYMDTGFGSCEIWEYRQVNAVFQFLDKHGIGDFRLVRHTDFAMMWRW